MAVRYSDDRSEYEGGGVMPNTVFPKGNDALTPADKLRLGYLTGQEEDSRASLDPGVWYGNEYFDVNEAPYVDPARVARENRIARNDQLRYRESRR